MIVLAIFSTIIALVWTWITIAANGMATAPSVNGFVGGGGLLVAWAVTALFWVAWIFN